MNDENVNIELNHFKIIRQVYKHIYPRPLLIIWIILSIVYPTISLVEIKYDFIVFYPIKFTNFIFPGVTGLSFSMVMLNATRNLYDVDDLKKIYSYTDDDNPTKGYLYNRTIAPYIISSYLWLIVSIASLFGSVFTISFPIFINKLLLSLFFSILIAGFMSLWSLVSTHISDLSTIVVSKIED